MLLVEDDAEDQHVVVEVEELEWVMVEEDVVVVIDEGSESIE